MIDVSKLKIGDRIRFEKDTHTIDVERLMEPINISNLKAKVVEINKEYDIIYIKFEKKVRDLEEWDNQLHCHNEKNDEGAFTQELLGQKSNLI